MCRTVSIGNQGFASIRENNCFYVDKTDFIRDWWDSKDIITLITRPRRFGKTLNMNMLECFFSNKYAGRTDLFEGLKIWEEEKYRQMQGTYPVIFISFAPVKSSDFEVLMQQIYSQLYDVLRNFDYLLNSPNLSDKDKAEFNAVNRKMDKETAINLINHLCKWLFLHYGKKAIVLLDEYDTPMQEAWISGSWDLVTDFFRGLFNATFKTNPYLERGMMTGITRVSKESIFSDLNNLNVVTTTSDQYDAAFGFTEEEVFNSLDEMELSGQKGEVKQWYDGFVFGNHRDIYNPWSITNFLKHKKISTYWADTSSNGLVSTLFREGDAETKKELETLMQGGSLEKMIDEQIVFSQLGKERNAIWSLLLASGYLKADEKKIDARTKKNIYTLKITNFETLIMFENLVHSWFSCSSKYNDFIKALLSNNVRLMNIFMNDVALESFSSFDAGNKASGKTEPEKFYHGFVLGLLVELRGRYEIESNKESGYGRYDIMLIPQRNEDFGYILEFKVAEEGKDLKKTVAAAKRQITKNKYAHKLEEKGIPESMIKKYGFAFRGKTVLIG